MPKSQNLGSRDLQPYLFICLKSYIPQPQRFSHLVQFAIATTLFSSLHQLGYNLFMISTSSFWRRSPMCHWAAINQAKMLEHKLIERLLPDQCLSNLVVVEWEEIPRTLQRKAIGKEPWLVARRKVLWTQQVWLLERQHQLQPRPITKQWAWWQCYGRRSRGYLNDLASYADRSKWMIGCRCIIQVINYVLNYSYFEVK